MNNVDDGIADVQAALITSRIGEAFGFLRDLIDDPSVAERIPDGSTLVCRSINIADNQIRLTAYRPAARSEAWSSRVTSVGSVAGSGSELPQSIEQIMKTGPSAEAALNALEAGLRELFAETNALPHRQWAHG